MLEKGLHQLWTTCGVLIGSFNVSTVAASQLKVEVFHAATFILKGILQNAVTRKMKFQMYLALSKLNKTNFVLCPVIFQHIHSVFSTLLSMRLLQIP